MADETTPNGGAITVSQAFVKAELLGLELRITQALNTALAAKADTHQLQDADQQRWVESVVYRVIDEHERRGWSRRERALALLNVCMTVAMVLLAVVAAAHGVVIP